MSRGVFVLGTDTDVGKTFITAGITYQLRNHGYRACSFKAVQSGGIVENDRIISGDTQFVKKICDIDEPYEWMNPYCLREGVSPHLAAQREAISIDKNRILDGYMGLAKRYDYVIAEGSGGIIVPLINNDYFIYDLIKDLQLPVVIVAGAGIGTINHTALTVHFAKEHDIPIHGIIINGYTGKFYEDDNIKTIQNITGLEVISVLHRVENTHGHPSIEQIKQEYEKSMKITDLLKIF